MHETQFAELIAKIAHELRSPLTSVKGFSSTLLRRWDRFTDDQRRQFVETIHADAERMARIITEVVDLARLESGRLQLNIEDVEVAIIARNALEDLSALPGAERIDIRVDKGTTVRADPERLRHVLRNVLENGVRFSDEGEISVRATPATDEVAIEVTDRGIGIGADRIDSIFSGPVARVPGSNTPSGSGLGLYLSRRLIEAHDGRISVESEEGRGSKFVLTLPAGTPS